MPGRAWNCLACLVACSGLAAIGCGQKAGPSSSRDQLVGPTSSAQEEPRDYLELGLVRRPPSHDYYKNTWAVVIGIDEYPKNGSDQPRLHTCRKDARAVYDALVGEFGYPADHVKLLVAEGATHQDEGATHRDEGVTHQAVRSAFSDWLPGQPISEADALFIFFSGHGLSGEKDGFLAAANSVESDLSTCVSLNELRANLAGLKCRHILVVLDCCYSGALFKEYTPSHKSPPTAFVGISSVGDRRQLETIEPGGLSVFTSAFLAIMKERAFTPDTESHEFTFSALAELVRAKVIIRTGGIQRPRAGRVEDGSGEFLFRPTIHRLTAPERYRHQKYAEALRSAHQSLLAGDTTQAERRLFETEPLLRRWEWQYLDGLLRPRHRLSGHIEPVHTVQFHWTKPLLLSVAGDKGKERGRYAKVWELGTGRLMSTLSSESGSITCGAFTGPGGKVVTGDSNGRVTLWDWENAKSKVLVGPLTEPIEAIQSSLDSDEVIFAVRGDIDIWEISTRLLKQRIRTGATSVGTLALSPDGRRLAAICDKRIRLWNIASGDLAGSDPTGGVFGDVHSLDLTERYLVLAGHDGNVRLWGLSTSSLGPVIPTHGRTPLMVSISPDDRFLAYSFGAGVCLWSIERHVEIWSRYGHRKAITSVAFDLNALKVATGGADAQICLWNLYEQNERDWGFARHPAVFSRDGERIAAVGVGHSVIVKTSQDGKPIAELVGHYDVINSIAFSPTNPDRIATASADATLRLWDIPSGDEIAQYSGPREEAFHAVTFSHDGTSVLCGGGGGAVSWLDADSGALKRILPEELKERSGIINDLALSPDGKKLAVAVGENLMFLFSQVQIWELPSGKRRTWKDHSSRSRRELFPSGNPYVNAVAFHKDSRRLAAAYGDPHNNDGRGIGRILLWDTERGKLLGRVLETDKPVRDVSFDDSGYRLIATGTEVHVFDCSDWDRMEHLVQIPFRSMGVAHSSQSQMIALASDDTLRIIRIAPEGDHLVLDIPAYAAEVHPDGREVAIAGYDGNVSIWDVETGNRSRVLEGHSEAVQAVAYSKDGSLLVSGGEDGAVILWDTRPYRRIEQFGAQGTDTSKSEVTSVAVSPDGSTIAYGRRDGIILLHGVKSKTDKRELNRHAARVSDLAYANSVALLASASDKGRAILWDTTSGDAVHTLDVNCSGVSTVAFSADDRILYVGDSSGRISLYATSTGSALKSFPAHNGGVRDMEVYPEGHILISCGWDGTIRFWESPHETRTAVQPRCVLYEHNCGIQSIAIADSGKTMVSVGDAKRGGGVRVRIAVDRILE